MPAYDHDLGPLRWVNWFLLGVFVGIVGTVGVQHLGWI